MRRIPIAAVLTAIISAVLLAACGDDDSPVGIAVGTSTPTGQRPTEGGNGSSADGSPIASPDNDDDGAGFGTVAPRRGSPFGGEDLVRALQERGLRYRPSDNAIDCAESGASGVIYFGANPGFVLWVYPDQPALEEDWRAEPGRAPEQTSNCGAGGDVSLYWNNNLVLMFLNDPEVPDDITVRREIINAFLSLKP